MWRVIDKWKVKPVLRAALQTAAAAVATYYLMQVLGLTEYFIGVLSAVYILTPSFGGTLTTGIQRVTATVVGSILGILCLVLLPNHLGTAIAVGVTMLVLGGVAHLKPAWSYGMVAALAVSLQAEQNATSVAVDRGFAILLGAMVGVLSTAIVWPQTARRRFDRHLAAAHRAIAERTRAALEQAEGPSHRQDQEQADAEFREAMAKARDVQAAIWLDRDPRRAQKIDSTDALRDAVVLLHRASDSDDESPLSTREGFNDEVEAVARHLIELIGILSGDKDGDAQEVFNRLDAAVEDAREILSDDRADADEHLNRAALIFGMRETRRSLSVVFEELSSTNRRGVMDTALTHSGAKRVMPRMG